MVKKLQFFCVAVLIAILFLSTNSAKAADETDRKGTDQTQPHIQVVASLINARENSDGSFTIPFSAQLSNSVRDKSRLSKGDNDNEAKVLVHNINTGEDSEIISGVEIKDGVIVFSADLLAKTDYEFEIGAIGETFYAEYKTPLAAEISGKINGAETNEGEFFEELSDFFEVHWHQILIYFAFAVILIGIGGIVAVRKNQIEENRINS